MGRRCSGRITASRARRAPSSAPISICRTAQTIIRKGYRPQIDSYSGFVEADRKTPTGLGGYLKERGVTRVVVVGLATDFCVSWTAQDAARAGLETLVVEEACRAIDLDGSLDKAWTDMTALGVKRVRVADLPA